MSDIQRYQPWPQDWPQEDDNGDMVLYEDHIKAVDAAVAKALEEAAGRATARWAARREHADKLFEMDYPEAAIDAKTVSAKADEAEMIAAEIRALIPQPGTDALRQARVKGMLEAEKALRDWQDKLEAKSLPETAMTIGMAADVVAALIAREGA